MQENRRNQARVISTWSALLVLALMLAGCAGVESKPLDAGQVALTPSGEVKDGVRVIKMEAKKYEFIPDPTVVQAGESVRLEVTSTDVTHGFALPELKIDRTLEPGKTEVITFTAPAPGAYPYHCSKFCGLGHFSMDGKLLVLPSGK